MSVLCGNRKVHSTPTYHANAATVRECFSSPMGVHQGPPSTKVVLDGTYTVPRPQGHITIRLATQPLDSDFAPGSQVAAFLSGPDNGSDYTSFAFVIEARPTMWRRFSGNTELETALARVLTDDDVLVSAACFRCGKELTTPESLASGFGPTCASKGLRG